jgi:hypothetical protein
MRSSYARAVVAATRSPVRVAPGPWFLAGDSFLNLLPTVLT